MKYLTHLAVFVLGLLVAGGIFYFDPFSIFPDAGIKYSSENSNFEVRYPENWRVTEDHYSYGYQTRFISSPFNEDDAVSVWMLGDQTEDYWREANKPGAKTFYAQPSKFGGPDSEDNGTFYVINYSGDVSRRDFNLIANSFTSLVLN